MTHSAWHRWFAGFDQLEASATDGFVAQIPLALIEAGENGGSVAGMAIEGSNYPWPKLPGKDASAGPFYLIWQYPERSQVANEQWPYLLERLTAVQSPERRWQHCLNTAGCARRAKVSLA
jgi:hypothetical protein